MNLFAYGTLMAPGTLFTVSGTHREGLPAILDGYRRFRVRGASYPALVRMPGHRVKGMVFSDLGPEHFERLDRFEGDMYERISVNARLENGSIIPCQTYLCRSLYVNRLASEDWDVKSIR